MSEMFDYRDEHNGPESASEAEETEGENVSRHVDPNITTTFHTFHDHTLSTAPMLYLGTLLYVGTLLVNALAVLNEERFLARSSSWYISYSQSLV